MKFFKIGRHFINLDLVTDVMVDNTALGHDMRVSIFFDQHHHAIEFLDEDARKMISYLDSVSTKVVKR